MFQASGRANSGLCFIEQPRVLTPCGPAFTDSRIAPGLGTAGSLGLDVEAFGQIPVAYTPRLMLPVPGQSQLGDNAGRVTQHFGEAWGMGVPSPCPRLNRPLPRDQGRSTPGRAGKAPGRVEATRNLHLRPKQRGRLRRALSEPSASPQPRPLRGHSAPCHHTWSSQAGARPFSLLLLDCCRHAGSRAPPTPRSGAPGASSLPTARLLGLSWLDSAAPPPPSPPHTHTHTPGLRLTLVSPTPTPVLPPRRCMENTAERTAPTTATAARRSRQPRNYSGRLWHYNSPRLPRRRPATVAPPSLPPTPNPRNKPRREKSSFPSPMPPSIPMPLHTQVKLVGQRQLSCPGEGEGRGSSHLSLPPPHHHTPPTPPFPLALALSSSLPPRSLLPPPPPPAPRLHSWPAGLEVAPAPLASKELGAGGQRGGWELAGCWAALRPALTRGPGARGDPALPLQAFVDRYARWQRRGKSNRKGIFYLLGQFHATAAGSCIF